MMLVSDVISFYDISKATLSLITHSPRDYNLPARGSSSLHPGSVHSSISEATGWAQFVFCQKTDPENRMLVNVVVWKVIPENMKWGVGQKASEGRRLINDDFSSKFPLFLRKGHLHTNTFIGYFMEGTLNSLELPTSHANPSQTISGRNADVGS